MRFRVRLADHASERSYEVLTDIFARLGDGTIRESKDIFIVDVSRSDRRDRLLYVLETWSREGTISWIEENTN